jgi:predicted aldo/keto reductase-like oxidoreductase
MERRKFIRTTAALAPVLSLFPSGLGCIARERSSGKLEKRVLGRTGEKLSIIGFGGIVVRDAEPEEAYQRVLEAIDYGVNYFDVAPSYGDAEVKLGPALESFRKDVFLSCKTNKRTSEEAETELEQSLKHLRTDHFDLYQLHAVTRMDEVDRVFSTGGAMETLIKAREDGRVKYLGFSAHSVEAAMELMRRFDFDTIMFPFNYATWHKGNFGPQVFQTAQEKGMGILALKAMAERRWGKDEERTIKKIWYKPLSEPEDALMGLRFTLSHPVTSAIPPGNGDLFSLGMKLAMDFKPLSNQEADEIKLREFDGELLFSYGG